MRIVIATWTNRRLGGVETYLSHIIPVLIRRGHDVALLYESDVQIDRDRIADPLSVPSWSVEALGFGIAVTRAKAWQPDVIYSHGLRSAELEAATLTIAPGVFFAHDYHGTCISGAKTHRYPQAAPCSRRFGWACLLHYYPRRCGGLNPVTMTQQFMLQQRRHALLREYAAVITHSEHMRAEYVNNGVPRDRVRHLSYFSPPPPGRSLPGGATQSSRRTLTFAGRMDRLKGGELLIAALPAVVTALGRPVHVKFAGDGPYRSSWERQAQHIAASRADISFEFLGWLSETQLHDVFADTDLLVFPSIWPEPLGLAGIEAGHHAIPVAAFSVGGVPEWLVDGVNGYSASGHPPTASGLAEAIIKCLCDPLIYEQLSRKAVELSGLFNRTSHLSQLIEVLEQAAVTGRESRPATIAIAESVHEHTA